MTMRFEPQRFSRALIGGMAVERFDAEFRENGCHRFEASLAPAALAELFTLERLEALLDSGRVPLAAVDVFDGEHLRRLADLQHKSGRSPLDVVAGCLAGGSTVRVRDLDRHDDSIRKVAAETARLLQAEVQCNLYLTPAGRGGFPPHFDITDVLVLQCAGSKQWGLYENYSGMTALPLPDAVWDPQRFRPVEAPEQLVLRAGDVLYVPRGAMHEAAALDEASLHLTFSVAPVTVAALLARAVAAHADVEPALRRRVPLRAGQPPGEAEIAALRDWLRLVADRVDFGAVLSAMNPPEAGIGLGVAESGGRLAEALAHGAAA